MVQWLALRPHNKKVLGLNPGWPRAFLCEFAWLLSKNTHIRVYLCKSLYKIAIKASSKSKCHDLSDWAGIKLFPQPAPVTSDCAPSNRSNHEELFCSRFVHCDSSSGRLLKSNHSPFQLSRTGIKNRLRKWENCLQEDTFLPLLFRNGWPIKERVLVSHKGLQLTPGAVWFAA